MRKRQIARYVPGLSGAVQTVESLEGTVRTLEDRVRILESVIEKSLFKEDSLVSRSEVVGESGAGDLPIPPPELRFLVAGTTDLDWFLKSGKLSVQTLVEVLGKQGMRLDQFRSILDQGCGCGRVIRHLNTLPPGRLHGCDVNRLAVRWCQNNFTHAAFDANGMEPPLPHPDQKFDLIYSWSIFTHFPESLQVAWMQELNRVLVPGGHVVVSLHGDSAIPIFSVMERRHYEQGNLVVHASDLPGSNYCSAFHPAPYVRNVLARGFDVVDFIPQGAKGNPIQDVYLLRKHS